MDNRKTIHIDSERQVAEILEERGLNYANIDPVTGTGFSGIKDIPESVKKRAVNETEVDAFEEIMCKGVPDFILWTHEEISFLEVKAWSRLDKDQIEWFRQFSDYFKFYMARNLDEDFIFYRFSDSKLLEVDGNLELKEK